MAINTAKAFAALSAAFDASLSGVDNVAAVAATCGVATLDAKAFDAGVTSLTLEHFDDKSASERTGYKNAAWSGRGMALTLAAMREAKANDLGAALGANEKGAISAKQLTADLSAARVAGAANVAAAAKELDVAAPAFPPLGKVRVKYFAALATSTRAGAPVATKAALAAFIEAEIVAPIVAAMAAAKEKADKVEAERVAAAAAPVAKPDVAPAPVADAKPDAAPAPVADAKPDAAPAPSDAKPDAAPVAPAMPSRQELASGKPAPLAPAAPAAPAAPRHDNESGEMTISPRMGKAETAQALAIVVAALIREGVSDADIQGRVRNTLKAQRDAGRAVKPAGDDAAPAAPIKSKSKSKSVSVAPVALGDADLSTL